MIRLSVRSRAVATAFFAASATPTLAQVIVHAGVPSATPGDAIVARARQQQVPDDIAAEIAKQAESRQLTEKEYPDLPSRSAEDVLGAFCGTVTDIHRAAYRQQNGLPDGADLSAPLGSDAYTRRWPACLYVASQPEPLTVEPGESLSDLYLRMTGRPGDKKAILDFFRRHSSKIQPGDAVSGQYYSLPSELIARPGSDLAALLASPAVAPVTPPRQKERTGEIIVAQSENSVGEPYAPPTECLHVGDFTISLPALTYAFSLSSNTGHDNQDVQVLIADNGFFGGTTSNGRLRFNGHFDRRVFGVKSDTGEDSIGPEASSVNGTPLLPLLTQDDVPILNEISGHGTHVTGLVLGGSAVGLESGLFDIPGSSDSEKSSWLKLREFPLSAGTQDVSAQAFRSMTQVQLFTADIVNLSVRYGSDTADVMRRLLTSHPDTLFVAAAGNDGKSVIGRNQSIETIHPGADGGPAHATLISVAAEDGNGYLTKFSNYGDKEVDIAAPGCNVRSWLDGTVAASLSGTSQAAPLVTMTAAFLARRGLTATQIKRRILLSGDLLKGKWDKDNNGHIVTKNYARGDDVQIASRSRLNILKALYFPFDYIDFEAERPGAAPGSPKFRYRALGQIYFTGKARCGRDENDAAFILAAKREDNTLWCFENAPLEAAEGSFESDTSVTVTVAHVLNAEGTDDIDVPSGTIFTPAPDDIHEFVLSDRKMTTIQGQ